MALTDLKIRNAKLTDKQQKLFDERGLHLLVTPPGVIGGGSSTGFGGRSQRSSRKDMLNGYQEVRPPLALLYLVRCRVSRHRPARRHQTKTHPCFQHFPSTSRLMTLDQNQVPRVGMLATVRNRRGVISAVEPYAASKTSELLHLVTIEFSDSDGDPEEQLLWERERQPVVLEPNALPRVDVDAPMRMHGFPALQRATRWTAITPFISAENPECQAEPVPTAPVYGAVSADDFSSCRWPGPSGCRESPCWQP